MNLPKEPNDPVLKKAMEEIKEVLRRHDVAGIVLLQSKTHGEWLNHINPSWSAAWMEDEDLLRIRARRADYQSMAARDEALRLTTSMLCGFRDGAQRVHDNMESVLKVLSDTVEITHISRFDR